MSSAIRFAWSDLRKWAGSAKRHWRRIVAMMASGVAIVRVTIWIAKAIASAGTVDTALTLIGLGEWVKPFEEAVDGVINLAIQLVISVTPTG